MSSIHRTNQCYNIVILIKLFLEDKYLHLWNKNARLEKMMGVVLTHRCKVTYTSTILIYLKWTYLRILEFQIANWYGSSML